MLLEMTEEQTLIVAMVRRFVREEILPLELNLDPDTDMLDPDDEARLTGLVKRNGALRHGDPPDYGGPDMNMVTRTLVAIEMSQTPGWSVCPLLRGVWRCQSGAVVRSERDDQEGALPVPDTTR